MVKLAAALLCAGCFLHAVAGQEDFSLEDALDDKPTKKPAPATKKPPGGDRPKLYPDLRPQPGTHGNDGDRPKLYPDLRPQPGTHGNDDSGFNLEDAMGGNDGHRDPQPYPRPPPRPGSHINSGDINDLDLSDGKPLPPDQNDHISNQGGNTVDSSTTAQITSPVVTVVVLLAVGAVAGYTAYKQKRYCFKPRGGAVV